MASRVCALILHNRVAFSSHREPVCAPRPCSSLSESLRSGMIRDRLIPELKREFTGCKIAFGTPPQPIAIFPAAQEAVGKVLIYDDGDEATVVIENITHTHFTPDEPPPSSSELDSLVTQEVVSFLKALFADRILLNIHRDLGSSGWADFDGISPVELSPDYRYYLWSKPFPPYQN